MNCRYNLSESEIVKAMQLHGRGSKATLIIIFVIGSVLAIAGVLTEYRFIAIASVIGAISGYFLILFGLIPFNAKKQFKQNRALRNEIAMELTDTGVNFKSDSGESKLIWADIHKWKSSDGIYLLYITSNMFHMVPSRALPDENYLAELLIKKVGPKKA